MDYYAEAVAVIPAVARVREARERLRAHIAALPELGPRPDGQVAYDAERATTQRIVAAALDGEPFPDVDRLAAEVATLRGWEWTAAYRARELLSMGVQSLEHEESQAIIAGLDLALTHLDGHLRELVDRVRRQAAILGGVRIEGDTAAAGTDANRVDMSRRTIGGMAPIPNRPGEWVSRAAASAPAVAAWDTLTDLAREYGAIRMAQTRLTRNVDGDQAGPLLRAAGEFRDLTAIWPTWRNSDQGREYAPPWGEDVANWIHAGPAFLAWLGEQPSGVVWVPTMDALRRTAEWQRRGGSQVIDLLDDGNLLRGPNLPPRSRGVLARAQREWSAGV